MTRHRLFPLPLLVVLLAAVVLAARGTGAQGEQYDLVLMDGRVLDPETGLDAKRNVGIRDGRIAAGGRRAPPGRATPPRPRPRLPPRVLGPPPPAQGSQRSP